MRKQTEIVATAKSIYATAKEACINANKNKVAALLEAVKTGDTDNILNVVSGIQQSIETIILGTYVDGEHYPEFISKIAASTTDVKLNIRTKLRLDYKIVNSTTIAYTESFVEDFVRFYLDSLCTMYYVEIGKSQIKVLNDILAEIMTEAGLKYVLEFAVDAKAETLVNEITDEKLVLNATLSEALNLASYGICRSGDEFSDLVAKEAKEDIVNAFKACPTTITLLKSNIKLIKDITEVSTKKRATTLIRAAYHKNANTLDKVAAGKSAIGYVDKKVDDRDIFALVKKNEDGTMSVVLTPFDQVTYENVDVAVI
jgi:hypothetical protein